MWTFLLPCLLVVLDQQSCMVVLSLICGKKYTAQVRLNGSTHASAQEIIAFFHPCHFVRAKMHTFGHQKREKYESLRNYCQYMRPWRRKEIERSSNNKKSFLRYTKSFIFTPCLTLNILVRMRGTHIHIERGLSCRCFLFLLPSRLK